MADALPALGGSSADHLVRSEPVSPGGLAISVGVGVDEDLLEGVVGCAPEVGASPSRRHAVTCESTVDVYDEDVKMDVFRCSLVA